MFAQLAQRAARWKTPTNRKARRKAAVEVAALESRSLLSTVSPIAVTESVSPVNDGGGRHRPVMVQVSGTVTDSDMSTTLDRSLAYTVFDTSTNRMVQSGTATINPDGSYAFDIRLTGRHHSSAGDYTIGVTASDSAGNTGSDSAMVGVTPDRGGRGRFQGNFGDFSGRFRHGGRSARLDFGGPGQDQTNTVSVPGSNDTVTQNVTNYQSNIYNISITTTNTNINNVNVNHGPPPPPPPPVPPPRPTPPPPPPGRPAPPPHPFHPTPPPGPPGPLPHVSPPGPGARHH